MISSGGVLVKGPKVIWTGTTETWGSGGPSNLWVGNRWASYATLYQKQVWVRTVVDKRALLLARLPLKVYEHDDLNRPEAADHPYALLLAKPNDRQSRFAFWLWMMTTYDIYGESFGAKKRDPGGRPVALLPLHPTAMREVEEKDGRTIWDFDNGKIRITGIPDEDLFHPRNYNPSTTTRGLSKLESLRSTLENEDAALRAQSSFWKNGARPGVALVHPGTLSQKASERLKVRWDAVAGGADKAGSTVVLEEGMKPEILQLTNEEAQYIDARRLNREETIAAYDIPPPAVHDLTRATFSNITAQLRSVYRDTMAPVTAFFESELETQVRESVRPGRTEPDFGSDVYAEFLLDGVLRGDFEQRAEAYQKAINSGWTTPAEVRKLENLPFIEGSDKLFINSTMVPVATAASGEVAGPAPSLPAASSTSTAPNLDLPDITGRQAISWMQLRTVMGRLSRQKSLDDIEPEALVEGLNGEGPLVLAALTAAKDAGLDVATFRDLLRELSRKEIAS